MPLIYLCLISFVFVSFQNPKKEEPIAPLLIERHSGKDFDTERSVTKDQITSLIQAARWTPSAYNAQPWNFIICDRTTDPEAYKNALESIDEENRAWAKNAPLLILAVASTKFVHFHNLDDRWGIYDTGAAALSLSLEAVHQGLMAHQIGGFAFDEKKLHAVFGIPNAYISMCLIAVGYESKDSQYIEPSRFPVENNFFFGKWKSS